VLLHLIFSGRQTKKGKSCIKPFWEITGKDAAECLAATQWPAADRGYFRGGGFSSQFDTKGIMPATISRVNLVKGLVRFSNLQKVLQLSCLRK